MPAKRSKHPAPTGPAVLMVWSYQANVLHFGILESSVYREYRSAMRHLDQELIGLLRRHGIGEKPMMFRIVSEEIRGFTSLRIIVATLNAIAWYGDGSVEFEPKRSSDMRAERERIVRQHAKKKPTAYAGPLNPHYAYPPDISTPRHEHGFEVV